MIQILLLFFGVILLLIGWYFRQHAKALELIFKKENEANLRQMALSLIITGIIGVLCGLISPTKLVALLFVAFVLGVSAFYSIRLSRLMK